MVERTNYRFYFRYDGKPVYDDPPTPKSAGNEDFTFDEWDVKNVERNQNKEDLRNRVIIEGQHGPHTEERHEAMPIELKGEASDATSIQNHGEHTLTIRNHFFQDQSTIDSYCATYKNLLKDPRWYFEFDLGQCPVPLEVGDTIKFKYRYGIEPATEK